MKKTIHDKSADNTRATDTGDGRIDAAKPSRRRAIKTLAATTALAATASSMPLFGRYGQVQSSEPIKIGFQVHRTGIGAAYGRWYDRTTKAAVKKINDEGGINGRAIEMTALIRSGVPRSLRKWRPSMGVTLRSEPCSAMW